MKIGFLGTGIMGGPMAKNLLQGGFDLTVWNRTPQKCAELAQAGAKVAATPRDVVSACDLTFGMLADPAAAEEVFFGRDGVAEAIAGKAYIDMSTVGADTSTRIAEAAARAGGTFLEAPVSGSRKPAEEGTLIILAAGSRDLYDRALPCFQAMGKKSLFLGEVGNAAAMKLTVNMVMGEMMVALCEGMALAKSTGLSQHDLLEVLDAGAMSNPMFRLKGPLIASGAYSVAFPLKHMQKDLRLALQAGDRAGQPLPAAAAVNEAYKRARGDGLGDEDFSAVYEAVTR